NRTAPGHSDLGRGAELLRAASKDGRGLGAHPGPGYGAQAREHLLEERRWQFAAGLQGRSLLCRGPGRYLRQIQRQAFLYGVKRSAHFATFGGSVATRIFSSSTCWSALLSRVIAGS